MSIYFDPTNLTVSDGSDADAPDINNLVAETDAAFSQVQQDMGEVSGLGEEWAENDPFVPVEIGKYSAKHYSWLAEQWAVGTPVDNAGTPTGDQSAKAEALDAAASASAASGSASAASGSASAASTSETNAGISETNSGTSETNALASEVKANEWAEKAEDVEVETGQYSALHWAAKAAESAAGVTPPSDVVYGLTWNGNLEAATKNTLYDKIESLAKGDVGLGNVDNTSDLNKPISTATQSALDLKANAADLTNVDNTSDLNKPISTATQTALDAKIDETSATGSAVIPAGTTAQQDGTPSAGYMRFNTDDTAFEGYDGTEWTSLGGGGLTWSVVTADTTAEEGNGYIVDTSVSGKTLTLPLTPTEGMTVGYKDLDGSFSTNPLTVDGNGANIQGVDEDLTVNSANAGGTLVYADATEGWVLTSATPMTTISSKPLLHVQDQKTTGTNAGGSSVGQNLRDLNTVLTNDISGASLSSNVVTLPAGEYYVEASAPIKSSNSAKLILEDTSGNDLVSGINTQARATNSETELSTLSGKFTLTATTDIRLDHRSAAAAITDGLGPAGSLGDYETYADLRIWRLDMDKVYPNLTDSSVALSKPLLHVQDRQTLGVNGQASATGANDRVLNTVVTNNITGASLASNEITLPAGIYEITAEAQGISGTGPGDVWKNFIKKSDDTVLIEGLSARGDGSAALNSMLCRGTITLATSTTIKLVTETNNTTLEPLGLASSKGSYEIYADIQIHQIDAVTQTPIVRQPINTPITNAYTTGGIYGGELVYVDADSIDVNPVSCYSDDLTTALFIDATTRVDIVGAAINTIYHMFLIKDTSNDFDVLYDTDVNGAGLPGTVSKKRWIGFVLTDSSGDIIEFKMANNLFTFTTTVQVLTGIGTSYVLLDTSSFVPSSRIESFTIKIDAAASISLNQVDVVQAVANGSSSYDIPGHTAYVKTGSTGKIATMHSVTLRR